VLYVFFNCIQRDTDKNSNDMKDKIEQIVGKVESGHLEPKEAVNKLLVLCGVSQQRELLNALADDFNEGTDTYVIQKTIEKTLKAFNCG